eukprot:8105388-Pyramimonas_sp.AAC.1
MGGSGSSLSDDEEAPVPDPQVDENLSPSGLSRERGSGNALPSADRMLLATHGEGPRNIIWTRFAPELTPTFSRAFHSARASAINLNSAALTASCTR